MSHEHWKNEINRWADSPEGTKVWCRQTIKWVLYSAPSWSKKFQYIVDDCHAELRKLQIDEPETKFEMRDVDKWYCVEVSAWLIDEEYRVKEEPKTETYYEVIVPSADRTYNYIQDVLVTEETIKRNGNMTKTGREFELEVKGLK